MFVKEVLASFALVEQDGSYDEFMKLVLPEQYLMDLSSFVFLVGAVVQNDHRRFVIVKQTGI